jgi:hypothetical protein
MGVNLKEITAAFLQHPPWWVQVWWTPWLFVALATLTLAYVFYRQVEHLLKPQHVPDTPISAVLDYIVNDSVWKPRAAPTTGTAPKILGVPQQGWAHQMALTELNEKLIDGSAAVWGYREFLPPTVQRNFDSVRRRIPMEYWSYAYLNPLACFAETATSAQTSQVNFNPQTEPNYTGLTLSMEQVRRVWPIKWWLVRSWNRYIQRKPRQTYWQKTSGEPADPPKPVKAIPLATAAKEALKLIEGTSFADELERIGKAPEDILKLTMTQFLSLGLLHGKKWSSETVGPVPRGGLSVSMDGSGLYALGAEQPTYVDLFVTEAGLKRFVEYAKNLDKLA